MKLLGALEEKRDEGRMGKGMNGGCGKLGKDGEYLKAEEEEMVLLVRHCSSESLPLSNTHCSASSPSIPEFEERNEMSPGSTLLRLQPQALCHIPTFLFHRGSVRICMCPSPLTS